jgi:regulator of replication initiation timing
MAQAMIEQQPDPRVENAQLRDRLEWLRAENERLRAENRELRATLDAHVTRARSTALFGPVEMSTGTCVGPRRRRR